MSLITELEALAEVLDVECKASALWAYYYRQWGQLDLAHDHDGRSRVYGWFEVEISNLLSRHRPIEKGKEGE